MRDWWAGPWNCEDCPYHNHGYAAAEYHRHSTGHTVRNVRGGQVEGSDLARYGLNTGRVEYLVKNRTVVRMR